MLDDVQASFLRSIDFDDDTALRQLNLAPLCARRDMAMLGLLHRIAVGTAPSSLRMLFPLQTASLHSYGWGHGAMHSNQLRDPIEPGHAALFKRSLFGLVAVYNRLSPEIAEEHSVKTFQRKLQHLLASRVGSPGWQTMLSRTF